MQVWVSGRKIFVREIPETIGIAYPLQGELDYDLSNGIPKTVKFIPKIFDKRSKKPVVCFGKSVDVTNIDLC